MNATNLNPYKLSLLMLSGVCITGAVLLYFPVVIDDLLVKANIHEQTAQKIRFISIAVGLIAFIEAFLIRNSYVSERTKLAIFLFPLLCMISIFTYRHHFGLQDPFYFKLVSEDNIVEYVTFISLVVASTISLFVSKRMMRSGMLIAAAFFVLLSVFLLVVALEEISYGQRIFGFDTPEEFVIKNAQKEFNIHNISSISEITYVILPNLVLSYCLFGWILVKFTKNTIQSILTYIPGIDLIFIPWYVTSFFIPLVVYRTFEINGYPVDVCCFENQLLVWQDQEPAEMFFGLGFLVFTLDRIVAEA